MKGSEAKMIEYMEGAGKRYVIPVYQRKYDWKEDNCRQLYEDLKKIVRDNRDSHFFGRFVTKSMSFIRRSLAKRTGSGGRHLEPQQCK